MHTRFARPVLALTMSATLTAMLAIPAQASHSWGGYHWGRTANPFALKLGDNVTGAWDAHLSTASSDWSASSVLDTNVVAGTVTNRKRCTPTKGRVEVCNTTYGYNGWLGIAGIAVSGGHITSGYVKLNDSYFDSPSYNTPAWRLFVTCQEIGHTLGLDHTDEAFDNANQGTCMDYTNTPAGPPSNEHPFAHDYEQLETTYAHLDGTSTAFASAPTGTGKASRSRRDNVDRRGNGTVTWIVWAS